MAAATTAVIASSYDLGRLARDPVYAARGEQGRIWRLETTSGSWAVKELLLPVTETEAAKDVEFQLAARAAGIPLPLPRRTRDGRVVLPAGEAAAAWSIRVYEWADLAPGQTATGGEIGAVTARLHRMQHVETRQAEAWFSEPIGERAWVALLGDARRANAPWAAALSQHLPELIAVEAVAAAPDPALLRTCHRDLNTENVLRAASGGNVVVDWENSGPDQPARELATVLADLAADIAVPAALDAYTAYLAAGGPERLSSPADFATAAAVQAHLLQFYSRRALDQNESPENRSRARSRLDHMLREPLTLSRINQLLGVLTRSSA